MQAACGCDFGIEFTAFEAYKSGEPSSRQCRPDGRHCGLLFSQARREASPPGLPYMRICCGIRRRRHVGSGHFSAPSSEAISEATLSFFAIRSSRRKRHCGYAIASGIPGIHHLYRGRESLYPRAMSPESGLWTASEARGEDRDILCHAAKSH